MQISLSPYAPPPFSRPHIFITAGPIQFRFWHIGFSLDRLKIQAVKEWPTPTTVKQVQSFLGFANFVRQFVANFSQIARPLHNLVKKEVKWQCTDKEEKAFRDLQQAIITAPVIVHADPAKPYFLETDASGAALGSVLSQRQDDGRLHPIGYLSESFKGAEQNYDTHDKELLAIIRSFEHWRTWNTGRNPEPLTAAMLDGTYY
ncbi:Retrotransposable element Tf2 155 kDa protein type 1 [Rhizoctonia solani AG-1 IB]|uniref:Retrotransposable element Tf2 155 kDa protein type 1 n=1 Tax=Thanatephorus cucumeris (strain AG1-IB / isolate 7/3/14) TaxID=1108050 RepID=M5CEE9_THACB|nr:Retrotransposable element Tf2 155 kDa protein type 1 [Rhizoctonia solani AG-1 IB]